MKTISFLFVTFIILYSLNTLNAHNITPYTLHGKVTDDKGEPLELVNVTIQKLGITAVTDNTGSYSFTDVPVGKYLITLKLTGYETRTAEVDYTGGDFNIDFALNESLIETSAIEVTATFTPMHVEETPVSVSSLEGKSLTEDKSQTLAQTISNIPGVSNISTGSNIGKPVIRGLSSNSVITVKDGIKQETQQWGDEHGAEIDLSDAEKVEILRGPSSIIYGSDGIGGVINVISNPLRFQEKKPVYYGEFSLGGYSMNNQFKGSLSLGTGLKNLGIKGHYEYQKSGNVKTPEGEFVVNTPQGPRTITGGELSNTASDEQNGGLVIGSNGTFGSINATFEGSLKNIQIHDDPMENPNSTSNQKVFGTQSGLNGLFSIGKHFKLEPVFSYQTNSRKEFETKEARDIDNPVIKLQLNTFQGNVTLHNEFVSGLSGSWGISTSYQTNRTLAEEKLIPNYNSAGYGIYALEKYNAGKFSLSAGARFDRKEENIKKTVFETDSLNNPSKVVNDQTLTFNALSGSFGSAYKLSDNANLFANVGSGWRPPSEFELFADGVHEGTGRYERGIRTQDPSAEPKPEQSVNIDAGLRLKFKTFSAELTLYRNQINNFIYPSPTGQFFVETDPQTGDTTAIFPIFDVKQAQSTFIGYEYSIQYQPMKWLLLSVSGDYVKTKNTETSNPLPFTPPAKNILEVKLQQKQMGKLSNPYVSLKAKFVSPQNDVDPLEAKTDGYQLFGLAAGFEFPFHATVVSADFSVDNLLNTKYVDHMSRYKYYALNPGRSFNLTLTVPFQFGK